jgi:hypothetical protein
MSNMFTFREEFRTTDVISPSRLLFEPSRIIGSFKLYSSSINAIGDLFAIN